MKCFNCGFDAENNSVCPICGAELAREAENTAAPEQSAPVDFGEVNPYEQPYSQPAAQPYTAPQNNTYQQNANPYAPAQPAPYPPQNAPRQSIPNNPVNPYQQMPPQGAPAPAAQPYAPQQYPQPPVPPAPWQYPPQNSAPVNPSAPKKNGSGGLIALGIVVGVVVLIGIALAIFSSILRHTFKSDVFERQYKQSSQNYYDPYDYYEDDDYDDYDFEDYSDGVVRGLGETYEFEQGAITLTKAEVSRDTVAAGDDMCQYAFTAEIKNTSDVAQRYDMAYITILDKYGDDLEADDFEYLYRESTFDEDDYFVLLQAGESAEVIYYYQAKKNYGTVYPEITVSDYDYTYSATADYRVNLSNSSETTEPATTKAN